jgi:hypothetical protein
MKIFQALLTLLVSFGLAGSPNVEGQRNRVVVSPSTTLVDGTTKPYSTLQPGDTVFFQGGDREYLLIRNFTGTKSKPVVFVNYQGIVSFNTDWYYGIKISNCRYIRLTGSGDQSFFYGFRIDRVKSGAGLSIGELSSDFEVDHIYINNVPIAGVYAKTDPDCDLLSTRGRFIQYNTVFHDNYIINTGNEGFYIGSSFYNGETIHCNSKDIVVFPSVLVGVRVYNNIVKLSGWDGIQVSSATTDCKIYNNLVMYDSQAGVASQMSGILIGGGSKCDCYNNYIYKGKGDGIESLGLGGYRIFNNIIVDAGRSYQPCNLTAMKHGIYLGDVSTTPGATYEILFNDIINPKSNGIRFSSNRSRKNLIASNAIINPGMGNNGYIVLTNPGSDVMIKNNYTSSKMSSAGFKDTTYSLLPGSPLINAGYSDCRGVTFDHFSRPRPSLAPDIGANEFNKTYPKIMTYGKNNNETEPSKSEQNQLKEVITTQNANPLKPSVSFTFNLDTRSNVLLNVYNTNGDRILSKKEKELSSGIHNISIETGKLPAGLYTYTVDTGVETFSGRFVLTLFSGK